MPESISFMLGGVVFVMFTAGGIFVDYGGEYVSEIEGLHAFCALMLLLCFM